MLKILTGHYIAPILTILIGLLIFLLGIKIMSSSFKTSVSTKVKSRINTLTSSKFISLIIGVIMTGLLQSSSATTLIVISLVHGELITLYNAVPIIMGANIGTTLTAQLVAYRLSNLTPYILILGVILTLVLNKSKYKVLSNMMLGLSFVFGGIEIISKTLSSLNVTGEFSNIIINLSNNNILAIFVGFLITAIIQSSSTGIAMLQIMASSFMIPVNTAIFVMLGQNIGTCANTLFGSIATNKDGKRGAIIHLLFNVIGVIIFYFFIDVFYVIVKNISPKDPAKQLANVHSIFNITTALILLPFSNLLVKIAKKIIRD